MECSDWGVGNRWQVCRIFCNGTKQFSQEVPKFYTCGAEGFWRPNPNPDNPTAFVFPACSEPKAAQKIFKLKLDYISGLICNPTYKNTLKDKIISALQELNREWSFSTCNQLSELQCPDLGINIQCKPNSNNRQKRQTVDPDNQSFQLSIQFPTIDADEVTSQTTGQTEAIKKLIHAIILNQTNANELPNVELDPKSINIIDEFQCSDGEVVKGNQCVPCPVGSYFDVEESNNESLKNG